MIYSFHQYELDASRYELRRDGAPAPILPKTFELLAYLVQRPGHMISKDELHSYLWPEEFVSESALIYHIAAARKGGRRQWPASATHQDRIRPRLYVYRPS